MIWKLAVCDDNAAEIAVMRTLLTRYAGERGLTFRLYIYSDGRNLVSAYEDEGARFDLILLDVLMEQLGGIDAAARLRHDGVRTPLVFFTTSRDYAVESYEVDAAGYLMKPVSYDKLAALLDRLLKKPDEPRLALRVHGDTRYLQYSEILFFESLDHTTYATLSTGETLRCAESLTSMQEILAHDPRFYRCHKGYLVNMDYIDQMEDVFILTSGHRVPYRIREKKKTRDDYYRYFLLHNL